MKERFEQKSKFIHKNDKLLLEDLKIGNPDALKALFYEYYNSMYCYGSRLSNDNEFIIDSIQDVFAYLWEYREKLNNVTYIKAYLFKMFRNRIFKKKTKDKFLQKYTSEYYDSQVNFEISQEDLIINEENQQQKIKIVNEIFKELTIRQREILFLKFYNNMTNTEISHSLSIEIQSVSNLLNRTFTALRKKIKTF